VGSGFVFVFVIFFFFFPPIASCTANGSFFADGVRRLKQPLEARSVLLQKLTADPRYVLVEPSGRV